MSLFARITLRSVRAAPVARFSTSAVAQKGPVETAKDTLKAADRTVSDAAVKGIETGEQVAASAKQTAGIKTEQAKQQAQGAANEASIKAEQAKQETKGAANEAAKKAEGAAQQAQAKTK